MAEFSIIDTYFNRKSPHSVDLGVGDDSALLTPPPQQQLVICADTLVAGRHFPLDTSPHAIGWKSVAVNLSDIAAMGAKPQSILSTQPSAVTEMVRCGLWVVSPPIKLTPN